MMTSDRMTMSQGDDCQHGHGCLMMIMESMTTRGTMMTRGWMTLTMLNYLNDDDDGMHDQQRDDVYKSEDELDDALLP